ncbi:DUF3649 domain-containing protein [Alcaligenaceae bacterium SJ-26]|nr:DUF3649 domain-containing protein [Alcaligenaceae bacterium SJ-26]
MGEAAVRHLGRIAPLVSRIVAAVLGGYALAALGSIAPLALPVSQPQAVLAGMMLSFLIYAGAVIWVFASRSAWRAWGGLLLAAVPLGLAAGLVLLAGGPV